MTNDNLPLIAPKTMPRGRIRPHPQVLPGARGFVEGTAAAVAMLIRLKEDTLAREIWDTLGYTSVPDFIDGYDAMPIRKALKQWNKK